MRPAAAITAQAAPGVPDRVIVSITDNGLGVPSEAREQIFRMFEHFHPDQTGNGIGPAIVHGAMERLKGTLGVDAAPGGTGSRFWFELPLA